MGFLHFKSTLKPFIGMCGMNGKNKRRTKQPLKKRSNPTLTAISLFFGSVMSYSKNDLQQKQFEKHLALFIAKELVPLSFVEVPFFQSLVLRQNPRFNFHLSKC
jgi:hypothetical protein